MRASTRLFLSLGALVASVSLASAQINIVEDTTWAADSIVELDDKVVVGVGVTLTIEQGVQVVPVGPGSSSIEVYGSLVVSGAEGNPVMMPGAGATEPFRGIYFIDTSTGSLSHAVIGMSKSSAIVIWGNDLPSPERLITIDHVEITTDPGFAIESYRAAIDIESDVANVLTVEITDCEIHDLYYASPKGLAAFGSEAPAGDNGADGTGGTPRGDNGTRGNDPDDIESIGIDYYARSGSRGNNTVGIEINGDDDVNPDHVIIRNTSIHGLTGQTGGRGGNGGIGGKGGRGGDGHSGATQQGIGNGGRGGHGGGGGDGGRGGDGGSAIAIYIADDYPPTCTITQCLVYDLVGGDGGQGGNGAEGGPGGRGGNGGNGNVAFLDGGNGGNGGDGGNGGPSGTGGDGGAARFIETDTRFGDITALNNTVADLRTGTPGSVGNLAGLPGDAGNGGNKGQGGSGGSNGSNGSLGDTGNGGVAGSDGVKLYTTAITCLDDGIYQLTNNIFASNETNSWWLENNGGSFSAFANSVSGFSELVHGTGGLTDVGTQTGDPMFTDPLNRDYRPLPGSPVNDAGNNSQAMDAAGLDFDLDGHARFRDDPDAPDSGWGLPNDPIVDLGAYEFQGCSPDLNGDGIVDQGDIQAFISFFLVQDLSVDFNGDGIVDQGDIQAFIAAFLAGC